MPTPHGTRFLAKVVGTVESRLHFARGEPDATKRKICGKIELPRDAETSEARPSVCWTHRQRQYNNVARTAPSSAGFLFEST